VVVDIAAVTAVVVAENAAVTAVAADDIAVVSSVVPSVAVVDIAVVPSVAVTDLTEVATVLPPPRFLCRIVYRTSRRGLVHSRRTGRLLSAWAWVASLVSHYRSFCRILSLRLTEFHSFYMT